MHAVPAHHAPSFDDAYRLAKVVERVRSIYRSAYRLIGATLLFATLLVGGIIIFLSLKVIHFWLKRSLPKEFILRTEDYKELRKLSAYMHEHHLDKLPALPSNVPKILIPIFNGFFEISQLMIDFNQLLNQRLASLDQEANSGQDFKHISGQELWNRRVEAYDYLI